MSCRYGRALAFSRSWSFLAVERLWNVDSLQGIECLIREVGSTGTNFSRSLLTYWSWLHFTVKSSSWLMEMPKNQDRGPRWLALNPVGPVNSCLNQSNLLPLWAHTMSSTYMPINITLPSSHLRENRQGSLFELLNPILSTRCDLNLSCHILDACLVPYNALRNFNTHSWPSLSLVSKPRGGST